MSLHSVLDSVTDRIQSRSADRRKAYLQDLEQAATEGPQRGTLSCGNLAHGFAACGQADKKALRAGQAANLAIVSSYNDMLSAHQPFVGYPEIIKAAARDVGAVAQFAGGVPAMCDGVTQGRPGMELSLFSRDLIAMSTAVALSHNMFDGGLCLGICDKIVPGLLIGALSFGHLPFVFVPGGPMPSGLPNKEKVRIRQLFAQGKVDRAELLRAESRSYHSPGTCTFYGTANSNQMLMELMGLHLPGAAFINPTDPLRDALTTAATHRVAQITRLGAEYTPVGRVIDEKAIVNGIVGLLVTGGSTNHSIHLIAIARAAGIRIDWDDFASLSKVVPLLCRIYPNGSADVNHFHAAGGLSIVVRELLSAGLLHGDVTTVAGQGGLSAYTQQPFLENGRAVWREGPEQSADPAVVAPVSAPFDNQGGLSVLDGNLGRGVIKTSAVKPNHRIVEAPARIFNSQEAFLEAFRADELNCDLVAVVRFQGPRANGMPELHKLTPSLGVLQDKGYHVALVTDGRMSGASGKVPAAIHMTPECSRGGPLALLRDGDRVRLDADKGILQALVDKNEWAGRKPAQADLSGNQQGMGRELFTPFRQVVGHAEEGASVLEEPAWGGVL